MSATDLAENTIPLALKNMSDVCDRPFKRAKLASAKLLTSVKLDVWTNLPGATFAGMSVVSPSGP